ncbi:hypothetical protein BN1013_01464 [Candidatus Rubidus massiliensis]|nr:hypothetical protein BN1013_01464 [Candidatus Rubidus massiliensis]
MTYSVTNKKSDLVHLSAMAGVYAIPVTKFQKIINTIKNIFTLFIYSAYQNYQFKKALDKEDIDELSKRIKKGASTYVCAEKIIALLENGKTTVLQFLVAQLNPAHLVSLRSLSKETEAFVKARDDDYQSEKSLVPIFPYSLFPRTELKLVQTTQSKSEKIRQFVV